MIKVTKLKMLILTAKKQKTREIDPNSLTQDPNRYLQRAH